MTTVILIGLGVLIFICLLDLRRARNDNTSLYGYFLLNGTLKYKKFVPAILAANLSVGNFLIFIASWGYLFGWGGIFWFVVNLCLNVLGYWIFLPKFKGYIEDQTNSGTIHEFLATTFSPRNPQYARRIRLVASFATIVGLLCAIVFEIDLATRILAPLLTFDRVLLFCVLCLVICIYSGVGGFHTLIFTDMMQSAMIYIGTALLVPILVHFAHLSPGSPNLLSLSGSTLNIGITNIIGICVVGSGWFLVAMDQWQRTCATRSAAVSWKGTVTYLFLIVFFALVFGVLGLFDKVSIANLVPAPGSAYTNGNNPLTDFFLLASLSSGAYRIFMALVAVSLVAAAMSTANTFLIVSGHSFVSDLLLAVKKRTSIHNLSPEEDKLFRGIARATIVGMGAFIIGVWVLLTTLGLLTDPLSFFFIAYSVQFALLAPMMCSRMPNKWRPRANGVFAGIVCGVIASLVLGIMFWHLSIVGDKPILGWPPSQWLPLTPVLTTLIGIIVIYVTPRSKHEQS